MLKRTLAASGLAVAAPVLGLVLAAGPASAAGCIEGVGQCAPNGSILVDNPGMSHNSEGPGMTHNRACRARSC